ncbi:hypothetical protein NC651_025357 [Populus alba x Populus x berolinensis]|nr:hypothetical protein NC651_025357 [Populus alba x Populus x berolinensis]
MISYVYLSRRRKLARLVLLKVLIKSKGECSESTRIPPEPLRCYCGTTSRRLLWSVIVKSFKLLQVFHYTLCLAVAILMTLELPYLQN